MTNNNLCDKCGKPVRLINSALYLQELVENRQIENAKDRHLYPEGACAGSPSRVKNIDTDPVWAKAYLEMQKPKKRLF